MSEEHEISFQETLRRLSGIYAVFFLLPNDEVGGIIQAVEGDGTVLFGPFRTSISFITSIALLNEEVSEVAPKLIGVDAQCYMLKEDKIEGVIQGVDNTDTLIIGKERTKIPIASIDYIIIPNKQRAAGSPLSIALKKYLEV